MKPDGHRKNLPFYLFCLSLGIFVCGLFFSYGVLAHRNNLFPIPAAKKVVADLRELMAPSDSVLTVPVDPALPPVAAILPERLQPGLLLIAGVRDRRDAFVQIIDRAGRVLHEWAPVWSEVWPEVPDSMPQERLPKGGLGMYLHGAELLPDASIVANFEHLSTFRMDVCGNVLWKLDNLGHHAVHYSDQGELWVTAERFVPAGQATGYQNHQGPLMSWSVQQIGESGNILQDIEIIDVLMKNDLLGLLSLSNLDHFNTIVREDTLHLNDVDIFPANQPSEVFAPGDIMVSLRNINAVLVFDPETLEIKFLSMGRMLRQHDPDFMPGDVISIFDNRNLLPSEGPIPRASRILEVDARSGAVRVALDGDAEDGFFTETMGVHQRLENGNILVTSSAEGRVLEYLADGQLAWRFDNRVAPDLNGRIMLAEVLPERMSEAFFEVRTARCK